MQHKHQLSDFRDQTDEDAFLYGFNDSAEEEDAPIPIHTGKSMPVWKTPSVLQDRSEEQLSLSSDDHDDSGSAKATHPPSDYSDLEDLDESDLFEDSAPIKATIISERPSKPSLWKIFTAFVARFIPSSFSDESFIFRLNLYLGGIGLAVALIILVVILVTRPPV
ncbi:MAG: hypothetical protein JW780_03230 [Clostridiales bacterium]|nr:hypothetical protein [Clostridiales bacterium]